MMGSPARRAHFQSSTARLRMKMRMKKRGDPSSLSLENTAKARARPHVLALICLCSQSPVEHVSKKGGGQIKRKQERSRSLSARTGGADSAGRLRRNAVARRRSRLVGGRAGTRSRAWGRRRSRSRQSKLQAAGARRRRNVGGCPGGAKSLRGRGAGPKRLPGAGGRQVPLTGSTCLPSGPSHIVHRYFSRCRASARSFCLSAIDWESSMTKRIACPPTFGCAS